MLSVLVTIIGYIIMQIKKSLRKKSLAFAISTATTVLLAGMGNGAFAQEAELEEITITGSRIVRRDMSAPSPIVTVGSELFENSATVGVESVLNQLPQFVPGATQFTSTIQSGPTSSPGAATLNLRGLGSNRNLVLINGRRGQPANASLAVDVNTIPASAIANVEVITGGASAVYGPDALAGVVNFVLKDDFEGVEFDFQMGETAEGDGAESKASVLFGANSSDGRGNIMIGLDWTKRDPIFQIDRDFYVDGWNDPANIPGGFVGGDSYAAGEGRIEGGQNKPSQAAIDGLFPYLPAGTISDTANFFFNSDGTIFTDTGGYGYNGPLNCWEGCGPFTGVKQLENGNLDQQFTQGYLSTPMDRHSLFLKGDYDINDNLNAFVQASYSNVVISQRGGLPPAITGWQAPVPRDGRTLPNDLNTLLDSRTGAAGAGGEWSYNRVLDFTGPSEPINTTNTWQFLLGLNGSFDTADITWEAYISRGDTNIETINHGLISHQRYQAVVAAPDFGVGRIRSGATFTSRATGYDIYCDTGLPIFSDFTPSQNCLDGIDSKQIDSSKLTQEIAEVNIQGRLLDIWAGEVRFAAGATYRENTYQYLPGNASTSIIDRPISLFANNPTGGKIDVTEYYGELLVPVIDSLDLELGYRFSDFSTAGGHDTFKALFTWGATETVTFRGGYQFATRAPNVAELFTAPTLVVVGFPGQEPCSATTQAEWGNVPSNPDRAQVQDLCRAIIGNNTSDFDTQTYSTLTNADGSTATGPDGFHRRNPPYFPLAIESREGNPNVGPEEGTTYTLGAVLDEPFGIESLNITVDAYQIEIEDAISPLSVSTIYDNCFNRYGTNPSYSIDNSFCQKIERNPTTGDRRLVSALFDNLGILTTQGVDVTVKWRKDIGPGSFSVNTNLNFLDSFEYQTAPGQAIVDATGTMDRGGLYDFRAFTSFSYSWDNFNIGLNWRHLSSVEDAAYAIDKDTPNQGTGSYDVFALNGIYNWENYSIRVGIDNLLDEEPNNIGGVDPAVNSNSNATSPGLYDVIGRRFYVGVKASF